MKRPVGAELSLGEPIQGAVNSLSRNMNCWEHPCWLWALVGARHLSKHLQTPALEEGREQGRGTAKKMLSGIAVLLKTKRLQENRRLVLQLELKIGCFSDASLK